MLEVAIRRESLIKAATEKGLNDRDIIKHCKFSRPTFRKIASGQPVSTKTAGKILKLLPDVEIFTPTAQI